MKPTASGDLYPRHINDRQPNLYSDDGDVFYLIRCFNCDKDHGRENHALHIAAGQCAWCGWRYFVERRQDEDDFN